MLAVLGALFANGIITILKFIGAMFTNSSGMMAESLHSPADTTNRVLLLPGLRFYERPASEKHPFGCGEERFFWSFIAAIFIFGVGATAPFTRAFRSSRTRAEPRMGLLGARHIVRDRARFHRARAVSGDERGAPRWDGILRIPSLVERPYGQDGAL